MSVSLRAVRLLLPLLLLAFAPAALAQGADKPFEPTVGQEGKDVIWVPTPYILVEKMLDMAKVTAKDFVMDLGSGDGRNIIAAAKRGARAVGVEFNPKMVEYARAMAEKAGVSDKAQFIEGDMFAADISEATVLALFLLPDNLRKLTAKFLDMKPGSRIVANGFGIDGWEADETGKTEGDCGAWCTAYLYIVPAKVAGTWKLKGAQLSLEQQFQKVNGTLTSGGKSVPITNGRLRGDLITFTAGGSDYSARVKGQTMQGSVKGSTSGAWTATRSDL